MNRLRLFQKTRENRRYKEQKLKMSDEENVKVAVRVRPFNKREIGRNAKLIVDMNGNTTTIWDPKNTDDRKKFTFDHSYWSFDGSKDDKTGYTASDPSHKNGKKFCDQVCIVDRQIPSIYNATYINIHLDFYMNYI